MKKLNAIKFIISTALIVVIHSHSLAYASSGFEKDLWKQHRQGKKQVINCFQKVSTARCYRKGLRNIVFAELSLINKGISPKNPELVSRFLKNLKTNADLPVMAWKLIKHQIFLKTEVKLDVWGSFKDEEFKVSRKNRDSFAHPVLVKIVSHERRD